MAYQNLQISTEDHIAIVTIDRQQALNAMNPAIVGELKDFFTSAKGDNEIRAIILTGAGEKAFIAGADIKTFPEMSPEDAKAFARDGQALTSLIESFPKPVIAAVNGYALGGGTELALACHLRFASENAVFGLPEVSLGIFPGWGGTQRLPRLIGRGRATELIISAKKIDAQTAQYCGLVNAVYPLDVLIEETNKFLTNALKNSPKAIEFALDAIHRGSSLNIADGLNLEADLFGLAFTTEDMQEGTRAFIEKRKPEFKGK